MVKKKENKGPVVSERVELFRRILVAIVTGIVLAVWKALIIVLVLIHLIMVLFTNKRNKDLAEFCEYWNSETYRFIRYLTFNTNERPFPFTPLKRLNGFE